MKNKDAIIAEKDAIIAAQNIIIAELKEQIKVMAAYIKQLEERIAQLEKNSGNSSLPPSSDIVKPGRVADRKKVKRKRGGQPGHKKHTRTPFAPEQVDKVIKHELKGKKLAGLIPLDEWYVVQQVTLPQKLYYVTEHRARKYLNPQSNDIITASMPKEVLKGGLFGADITAMTAYLKGSCHMSFSTIKSFLEEIFKLKVSRGMLCKKVSIISDAFTPAYNELLERLPQEKNVGIDETGHKNNGKKHWTWCFQTTEYSLFHIDQSRGSKVLFDILGQDFTGIINSDFFGAYRKYVRLTEAQVQYCMAHLIREIKFLAELTNEELANWGNGLLGWVKKLFKTLRKAEKYTAKGYAARMRRIKAGFLDVVRRPPDHKFAKKLSRRFSGAEAENYFRFLTEPGIEPTNNGTEREIRHTVIDRRITQGTRGDTGMRWCERVWTTIATCKKQKRNVLEFIHHSILAHWNNRKYPILV
ncbi:MAG: IS66 family transposase [Sedimentisphaerales bacterium]|nr:IS66 family transposase [Sedimentisphaerales bacterium]